jgi:hypothetical protein
MSLNSLALGAAKSEIKQRDAKAQVLAEATQGGGDGIPPGKPRSHNFPNGDAPRDPPSDILSGLTKYIPTESITLYVSTVSAQQALKSIGLTPAFTYWFFVGLTPLLLITLFLRQLAVEGSQWRVKIEQLPWWQVIASTIAFMTWALAVPGNPIISPNDSTQGAVAALAATFVSIFLNIFEPFFKKP